jgi:hypothetical protein
MNREKQIEEMAKAIETATEYDVLEYSDDFVRVKIDNKVMAKSLYNAGYRKQSEGEWISVDERLPEDDTRVLVYLVDKRLIHTQMDTDRFVKREWIRWGSCVTHWMPLPEPPKMKGGEG